MKLRDLQSGQIALIDYQNDKVIIMKPSASLGNISFYILGSLNGSIEAGDALLPPFLKDSGDDQIIKLLNLNLENLKS